MLALEPMLARLGQQALTRPELLYGFVGAVLTWQAVYWLISRDPHRYRPLMPLGAIGKVVFGGSVWILFAQGRVDGGTVAFSSVDLVLAALFIVAWRRTA